jgi:hypothetical protein
MYRKKNSETGEYCLCGGKWLCGRQKLAKYRRRFTAHQTSALAKGCTCGKHVQDVNSTLERLDHLATIPSEFIAGPDLLL